MWIKRPSKYVLYDYGLFATEHRQALEELVKKRAPNDEDVASEIFKIAVAVALSHHPYYEIINKFASDEFDRVSKDPSKLNDLKTRIASKLQLPLTTDVSDELVLQRLKNEFAEQLVKEDGSPGDDCYMFRCLRRIVWGEYHARRLDDYKANDEKLTLRQAWKRLCTWLGRLSWELKIVSFIGSILLPIATGVAANLLTPFATGVAANLLIPFIKSIIR